MSADIRPAEAHDIDALLSIENEVFETDRISRRSFRRLLKNPTANVIVAAREGAVKGYALVLYRRGSGVARLYSLAVSRAEASRGIGAELLKAAEREAAGRGCGLMRLQVREENERAIALYRRAGYRDSGRRDNYYQDGAPALYLEKSLEEHRAA